MRLSFQRFLALVLVSCATSSPAPIFMKYDDIPGESAAEGRADWMDVLTVSNPFNPGSTPGTASSSLMLTKHVDKASPKLFERCAAGTVSPLARLEFMESTPSHARVFDIRLENVRITELVNTGQSTGPQDLPTESLSLNFDKITWTYTTRRPQSRLPRELHSTSVNLVDGAASGGTNAANFSVTGIRKVAGQVQLEWQGIAGRAYDIYSVSALTGPFNWRRQLVPETDGTVRHTETILPGTLFFVVEERP